MTSIGADQASAMLGVGEALLAMVREAVQHGLDARREGDNFTPILIGQPERGQGHLTVLATETTAEAIASAHWLIENTGFPRSVLAYDGYITTAQLPRSEAIHIEAYEAGRHAGVRFAQRYHRADTGIPFGPTGNLLYLGPAPYPRNVPRPGRTDAG